MLNKSCRKCGAVGPKSICARCSAQVARAKQQLKNQTYNYNHYKTRQLLLQDNPLCYICGQAPATHADHNPGGYLPLCASCNSSKGGTPVASFVRSRLLKSLPVTDCARRQFCPDFF